MGTAWTVLVAVLAIGLTWLAVAAVILAVSALTKAWRAARANR